MNLAALAPAWLSILLAALLLIAAAEDVWRLRISNWTCGAILLGAVAAAAIAGPEIGLWQNFAMFVAMLAAGTLLFSIGALGGGDVKLLAATALWFDLGGALRMVLAVALVGGLLTIVVLVVRQFRSAAKGGGMASLRRGAGIPYGVAIAAGALLTIALQRGLLA